LDGVHAVRRKVQEKGNSTKQLCRPHGGLSCFQNYKDAGLRLCFLVYYSTKWAKLQYLYLGWG
jgi:hypothetical protein